METALIYKIMSEEEWRAFQGAGVFTGSPVDIADGFIHFSTANQVMETAARHFAGRGDLVLLGIDPLRLNTAALRLEPSRNGGLFPHLYAPLPLAAVARSWTLPWQGAAHAFPAEIKQ